MIELITMIFTFFSFSLSLFYMWKQAESGKVKKRVEPWFQSGKLKARNSFIFLIGDKYDNSELSVDLRKKILQANLSLKASEYMGVCIILCLILWFITHSILKVLFPIDVIVTYLAIRIGSRWFLNSKKSKRSEDFNKQLPEVCRLLSSTIKAGLTLPQGIETVSLELMDPVNTEFKRMTQELRLGDPFDQVMERLKERISSKDLNVFVNTILIQRKVGGNLSEVLSLMAETLEERARINKEIKTLTAEAKSVAFILPVLPIIMLFMMNMIIEGFITPLFTPLGLILLGLAGILQIVAFLLIRKVTNVRV